MLVPAMILVGLLAQEAPSPAPPTSATDALTSQDVSVEGDVKSPGRYAFEVGATAGAMLEKAGGLSAGTLRDITVHRRAAPIPMFKATATTSVQPGDLVYVQTYKIDFVARTAPRVMEWLSSGDFESVMAAYRGAARRAIFEDKLRSQWRAAQQKLGTLERHDVRTEVRGESPVAVVLCRFSNGSGEITIVFDRNGGITDFTITPALQP